MKPQTIRATLECDTDGTWHYIHIPKEVRDGYKQLERRGATAITITIGGSTWEASILPWADGSGQISVNKKVRIKEDLQLGQHLVAKIMPRERTESHQDK